LEARTGDVMTAPASDFEPSRLQRVVETIAISSDDAAELVDGYRASFSRKHGRAPDLFEDKGRIAAKIVGRYSRLAAASGVATAMPGVVPGVGTAVAAVGGTFADLAASTKLQVDMCMCLVQVYRVELGNEEKKHLAFVLALAGSVEQIASNGGRAAFAKVAEKLVFKYLSGPTLVTVKQLFGKVAINFTQKAAAKAIPLGVGAAFSGSTNYVLTAVVGKIATAVLEKDV